MDNLKDWNELFAEIYIEQSKILHRLDIIPEKIDAAKIELKEFLLAGMDAIEKEKITHS